MVMQTLLRGVTRYGVKPIFSPRVPIPWQRRLLEAATRLRFLPRDVHCSTARLGSVAAQKLTPRDANAGSAAILFLHGGAYCVGSPETHRNLCSHLARAASCTVYSLDYGLAPEHPFPAGLDDAWAAWQALQADGLLPSRIAVAGDSAGGGLALALMLRLRAAGQSLPAALYLISPWTDLTLSGETVVSRAAVDPLLSKRWGEACAALYTAGHDNEDPLVSPLFADCASLPAVRIDVGSDEVLFSDAERFAARAREAGGEVDMHVHDGLWHDFQMFAGMMPEATRTLGESGRWLRERLST